jgi:hypothetical protein
MNTKTQQGQKKNQQRTRQQGSKKRGQDPSVLHQRHEHEQEHPETRLFR